MLVYQALVPKLCRCCALPTSMALRVDPDAREIEEVLRRRFGLATAGLRWVRPEGCCNPIAPGCVTCATTTTTRRCSTSARSAIRIDGMWLAVEPVDMRAGPDRLLARVVEVFGAARAHHG